MYKVFFIFSDPITMLNALIPIYFLKIDVGL